MNDNYPFYFKSSHNSLEFKFDDSQQNQDDIRGWNVRPRAKPSEVLY